MGPFEIIHLLYYLLALIPSIYIAFSIDYSKFIRAKSNLIYYACAIMFSMALTLLVGEFLYKITTMFIK